MRLLCVEGTEGFVLRVKEALDLLKSRAPEWYAYVIKGPLKIRESYWAGASGTLERSVNLHPFHASQSIIPRARVLVHEGCHVQRWLASAFRYETDIQQRTEENLCEILRTEALEGIDPARPPNVILQQVLADFFSQGHQFDFEGAVNVERHRAYHLLSTMS